MRNFTKLKLLALCVLCISQSKAQTFFTEDFEGAMDPGTNLPTGWQETGLSSDGIWSTGNAAAATSAYLTWPATTDGTRFAFTNDDACNCDKSVDRVILPVQDFSGMAGVNLIADIYVNGGYGEAFTCEVSTDAGASWTVVKTYVGNATAWTQDDVTSLAAYAGMANITISFLYNDASGWAFGAGIDQVRLVELASAEDLAVIGNNGEYTSIPMMQTTNMLMQGKVHNDGVSDLTDVVLIANVYMGGVLQTTLTSAAASILSGDTLDIDAGMYQPMAIGNYSIEYVVSSATITDGNETNDTNFYNFSVVPNYYARDNSNVTIALGVGAGNTANLGNIFEVTNTQVMDSVFSFHNAGALEGDTIQFEIYSTTAGIPDVLIGLSDFYIVTAADAVGPTYAIVSEVTDLASSPLSLTPGTYFVSVKEFTNTANYSVACTDGIYTEFGSFGRINGGPWMTMTDIGFAVTPVIRPRFTSCAETTETVTVSACDSYTWAQNTMTYTTTGSYVDTIPNAAGCDSIVTLNLTIETLDLSTTVSGATITATTSGATYQWIDCGTNTNIGGATSQAYTATANGDYAVVITNGSCSDTSSCTTVSGLGIDENQLLNLSVYPNPSNGNFDVSLMGSFDSNVTLTLVDLNGKVLMNKTVQKSANQSAIPVSVKSIENGIYLLKVSVDGYESTNRIVISK